MEDGGSSAYIPANVSLWHNGGGSGAAYIANVELDGTYNISIGSGGNCSGSDGHDGGDTSIVKSGLNIIAGGGKAGGSDENREWYEVWKWFEGGGEAGTYQASGSDIKKVYLRNNGEKGDAKAFSESIGGTSVMSSTTFKTGIGNNRGYGGSKDFNDELPAGGGCLYILPNTSYCVCTITAPEGTQINANVSEDYVATDGNYIQNTNIQTGAISGTTNIQFIVKKGATVSYSARKDYMIDNGSFTAGENVNSDNEQQVNLTLKKEIVEHTIYCKGDFKITGEFTDDNGNITSREKTGTNSITFKVWKDPSHNSVTVSKAYYDSTTIQITDNGTTTVNLRKTKYYLENATSSDPFATQDWKNVKNIESLDGNDAKLYFPKRGTASLSGTITGLPQNWTLYVSKCRLGLDQNNSNITININGENKLSEPLTNNDNKVYTLNGTGNTLNLKVTFKASIRTVMIDAIYCEIND